MNCNRETKDHIIIIISIECMQHVHDVSFLLSVGQKKAGELLGRLRLRVQSTDRETERHCPCVIRFGTQNIRHSGDWRSGTGTYVPGTHFHACLSIFRTTAHDDSIVLLP